MASPQEKLAKSLEALKQLQDEGRAAVRAKDLSRTHREILLKNGFLQMVMKGWYIPSRPDDRPGDTTPWYSSFWDFCASYANERFGDQWCLSAEQSLLLHVGNRTVPQQLTIRTPKGGNKPTELLHKTSIFDFRGKLPDESEIERKDDLNIYDLPSALIESVATFYRRNATDARAALAAIPNASILLAKLLDGGRSTIAGRLCGAFRNIGRVEIADEIKKTMKAAGYEIVENDPFKEKIDWDLEDRVVSPHAARLKLMWQTMREVVIETFPSPPAKTTTSNDYLKHVEDAYVEDAYHSLSIEGYQVSPELIEKVRSGKWNPEQSDQDRQHHDALAARGYFQAFRLVKKSVGKVLKGKNAGAIAKKDHGGWYRELFVPLVSAGLLNAGCLAGYRNSRVFIKGSRHVPAAGDAISDLMPVFFEVLENEPDASVRAVLGHFCFVFIHPYSDGNGRTARFLMNLMLASGGYPWTVVPVDQRKPYMDSLEFASVEQNIAPFAAFLGKLAESAMND